MIILNKIGNNVGKLLVGYGVIAIVTVLLFKTVFMLSVIPSASMESTIMTGDIVISSSLNIGIENIERYDVLIFQPPTGKDEIYIKRVIGLPGETIEVKDGKVYADGIELDDSFTNGPQNRNGDGVWEVPEGHLFFMGDNRNNSQDSRFWGDDACVPIEKVKAKSKMILLPFSHLQGL